MSADASRDHPDSPTNDGSILGWRWDHVVKYDFWNDAPGWLPPDPTDGHAWLYVLWSAAGTCLYVGQTTSLRERLRAHRKKPWGSAFEYVTLQSHHPTDIDVLEAVAIRTFRPAHNLSFGPTRGARRFAVRHLLSNSREYQP